MASGAAPSSLPAGRCPDRAAARCPAAAPRWRDREEALTSACGSLLSVQRERGLPTPDSTVIPFYDRPYRALDEAVPRASSTALPTRTSDGCRRWWAASSSGSTPSTSCPARAAGPPCGRPLSLGQHELGRRRCRRQSSGARWRRHVGRLGTWPDGRGRDRSSCFEQAHPAFVLCDVVARVAPVEDQVAQFEIELAQLLAASGCPVAALEARVEQRLRA